MDITKLTATPFRRLGEKRREESSRMTSELIAAGFGLWTGNRIREAVKAGDPNPLFLRYITTEDAACEAHEEEKRRYRYSGSLKPIRSNA